MGKSLAPILDDILKAIDGALAATQSHTAETFAADWVVRHAVQRALEIISEASRRIPDIQAEKRPEIPWRKVRALGNLLRHEYHAIHDEVVWRITRDDLPKLRAAIVALQSDTGP